MWMKQWPSRKGVVRKTPTANTITGLQIARKVGPWNLRRGHRGLRPASALPAHCGLPELLFVVKCHSSRRKSTLSLSGPACSCAPSWSRAEQDPPGEGASLGEAEAHHYRNHTATEGRKEQGVGMVPAEGSTAGCRGRRSL